MLRTNVRTFARAGLVAGLLAGCGSDPSDPQEQPREDVRNFTTQESRVADASVGFGLGLYQQVAAAETEANVLVSPLSASMALGMTMNGAQSATWDAMRSTLGFGTLAESEINAAYKGLIAQLLARDAKVTFKIANSIWHERSFSPLQPFLDATRNFFGAQVTALDFAQPSAPITISTWAERETAGRIKDLVTQIDAAEIMFLVNAVYFKAPWSMPFDERSTRNGSFVRLNGSTVSVPLMTHDGNFRWVQNQEVTALELLYADSAFSMVLVMPRNNTPLSVLESRLSTSWWTDLMAGIRPSRAMVTMPKFKFDYGKKLNDALTALGMGVAFDRTRADFYRIADVRPERLYITRVEQKTFISVDEKGTEAAAATTVGIGVTSLPPQLDFTKPFLFAIRERESGTLLFLGRVGDPSAN